MSGTTDTAKDLTEVVAEIVNIERQHKLMARNVRKDVADQINTLGGDLAAKLAADGSPE